MITLAEHTPKSIETIFGRLLHVPATGVGVAGALASESLRAMIFGASLPERGASASRMIHSTRLLTTARRAIDLVWPRGPRAESSDQSDICSAMLERLGLLGDAYNLGQGQWMATPLRIIVTDDNPSCLLLGSAPIPVVQKVIGTEPTSAGAARFVGERVLEKPSNRDISQSLESWLGRELPLTEWTARVLNTHESSMQETQGASAEQLEIYAPDILRNQRRSGRWIAAHDINRPVEGVRLCRPQMRYAKSYDRPQYLAHFGFSEGALVLRRSAPIRHELTLRLRFGLDAMLNTLREVSIVHTGQTFRIDRPLSLPQPEQRLYALGWEEPSLEAPQRLIFPRGAEPFLLSALQRRLAIAPSVTPRSLT